MTGAVVAYWLLTALAGAAAAGLVRVPLRIEERVAVAAVAGIAGGTALAFLWALLLGMTGTAVLAGPATLLVLAVAVSLRAGDPLPPWRDSVAAWRTAGGMERWALPVLGAVAAAGFTVLFRHTLFTQNGDIVAGFPTVWADWSFHATASSSFAVGHNLPPHDPIFSGGTFRYPFMPDFNAAMLQTTGQGIGGALAAPDAVMMTAIVVLAAALTRRVTRSFVAGAVVAGVLLLGGGLGFSGVWWDSCARAGHSTADCAPLQVVTHPVTGLSTAADVLHDVPGIVADQPRAYDGLLTDPSRIPGGNVQWYTPLLAWWLPQRSMVFGAAMALAALVLVRAALERPERAWSAFAGAGALLGLLPIFHVHSLIAMAIVLPLLALLNRRREWVALGAVCVVLAAPRLLQLVASGHGSDSGPFGPNSFPWLEPGWKWNADPAVARLSWSVGGAAQAVLKTARLVFTPGFWGFWVLNAGVLVPLCLVAALAVPASRARGRRLFAAATRVTGVLPGDLLRFVLPFMAIWVIANVVVFQSWDWDNTKVLVYWQLGAAMLLGAWAARWWRGGPLRATVVSLVVLSVVASGALAMLRMLPWTPSENAVGGPYSWASVDEQRLAQTVELATPRDAVVLTGGRPNDPLLTLAGRTALMGYAGWLNSYGTDFGTRPEDVSTMYRGCGSAATCVATDLLHRYGISFVEVGDWERQNDAADTVWWSQHFPVLARGGGIVVYDVRRP